MKKLDLKLIIGLAAISVVVWVFISANSAGAVRLSDEPLTQLTADDLAALVKSEAANRGAGDSTIATSAEARRKFSSGLREHLALAAAARSENLHHDGRTIQNYRYKRKTLVSQLYEAYLKQTNREMPSVSDEVLAKLMSAAEKQEEFESDMKLLQGIQSEVAKMTGSGISPGTLQGESLEAAKKKWARADVISTQAEADPDFMSSPDLALRLKVLETGILSNEYLRKHWETEVKASSQEIAAFISQHPEYSVERKKALANEIYAKVKAGENFEKLAREISEHRPSKPNGGLIEGINTGDVSPELESALMNLEPGSLAPAIIESELGFHIVKLISRKPRSMAEGSPSFEYSFRQILLQRSFEQPGVIDPNVPPPFMAAEEIARTAIEKEKLDRLVARLVQVHEISVPEDFTVVAS